MSERDNPIRDFLQSVARKLSHEPLRVIDAADDEVALAPGGYSPFFDDNPIMERSSQRVATTLENDLTLTIFSALNATVLITGMVKRPNGETQPIGPNGAGFFIAVIGDRVPRTISFPRGSGVDVIGLSIAIVSASPRVPVGACWAIVQQSRALPDGTQVITGTLVSGPVTQTQALGWPGSPVVTSTSVGYIRSIAGATPAAGAELLEIVPTGARWDLNSATFNLATGAAVGNRLVLVQLNAFGIGNKANVFASHVQPASAVYTYEFGTGLAFLDSVTIGVAGLALSILPPITMNASDRFQTTTVSLAAADQFSTFSYTVIERLDP